MGEGGRSEFFLPTRTSETSRPRPKDIAAARAVFGSNNSSAVSRWDGGVCVWALLTGNWSRRVYERKSKREEHEHALFLYEVELSGL